MTSFRDVDTIESAGLLQRIVQQTRDRHRTDPTRNRGNRSGDFGCAFKFDITYQAGRTIFVFDSIDTNVYDRGARFYPVALNHFGPSYRGHQDICLATLTR
jgi:hypothetical protein